MPVYSQADPASSSQITAALASSANDAEEFEEAHPARVHMVGEVAQRNHLTTESSSDGAIESESSLADGTGSFETIVLEGDAITQTEEFVPEESIDNEIAALTERLSVGRASIATGVGRLRSPVLPGCASRAATQQDAPPGSGADPDDAPAASPWPRRRAGAAGSPVASRWCCCCCFRASITGAMRSPPRRLERTDGRGCTPAGRAADPHWNLSAYDVRQQGAATDPGRQPRDPRAC